MPSIDALVGRHRDDPALLANLSGIEFGNMGANGSGIIRTSPGVRVPCRLCQGQIAKGEKCFAWIARMERPLWVRRNTASPGRSPAKSSGVRWFVHFGCLIQGLENLADGTRKISCGFCHNGDQFELTYVRRGTGLVRACPECVKRFPILCSYCTHYVEAAEASITLTPYARNTPWGDDSAAEKAHGVVCDVCATSYGLDTINTRRTAHRASRREWAKVRIAGEEAQEWLDG